MEESQSRVALGGWLSLWVSEISPPGEFRKNHVEDRGEGSFTHWLLSPLVKICSGECQRPHTPDLCVVVLGWPSWSPQAGRERRPGQKVGERRHS